MKKGLLIILLFIILIICIDPGQAQEITIFTTCNIRNDTLPFNEKCIDTIYLPIYKPTDKCKYILDKVKNTKHQNLTSFPERIFSVSEEIRRDTTITVYFNGQNLRFFSQYGWNNFRGLIFYDEHIFLLDHSITNDTMDLMAQDTGEKRGFPEYVDKLFVKVDEKLYWVFAKRDNEFHLINISPPSTMIDFDVEIGE